MSFIKLKNVSKFYSNKKTISTGFSKISLDLDIGEFVVFTGESGSGKSTLLNVISGLDSYEEGEMYINGEETSHYTEVDYENYRRKYIGNIFQNFNLVNSYTVYQNVELVLLLNGYKRKECKDKVLNIIKTVGLTKYKNTKASKLSGGQKQRVAIARALAKDTPVIVADEPTGNLDVKSAKSIMKLLKDISSDKLFVIVTHNYEQVEEYATRKISMNDGHIIEDKKIASYEVVEPKLVKYKDLTRFNKLRLGIRNSFNIKTKFALLFFVYFFLTFLVFSEYSGLSKMTYDESLDGYNENFVEIDPRRVIINKKDKTAFTTEEIEAIGRLDNIKKVEPNDLLLDYSESIYNENVYFYGKVRSLSELDRIDMGEMPVEDDQIVVTENIFSYYVDAYGEEILKRTYDSMSLGKVRISGIKIEKEDEYTGLDDVAIYVPDAILDKAKLVLGASNSKLFIKLNNKTYNSDGYDMYFTVKSNELVPVGKAFVPNTFNTYCSYYQCLNKSIEVGAKNLYYEDSIGLSIKKVLNKDNFKSATGLTSFEENSNTIFISEQDYRNLFVKGDFQISAFIDDLKNGEETIEKITDMGYQTFYVKDALANPSKEMLGILRIFRNVVFIIATVALFFISYFIIKIILKSRNVYFSTLRILGATKKVSKQLLNIELFIDINLAYLTFIAIVIFATSGIINVEYINELVTYFTLRDYVLIYLVLVIMSLLISNRFAKKLFKDSAMNTYREEV